MADQNTNTVVMLDPQGNPGQVSADKVASAQAAGYTPAVKMQGPTGELGYVAQDKVAAARQNNFAVVPQPGVQKAVDYKSGEVKYILPSEAAAFQQAGHAIVQSDGSITWPIVRTSNGVIGQDPLEEQIDHERVFKALSAEEKHAANMYDLKEFAKAGVKATTATAMGVTGSSALGAAADAIAGTETAQLIASSPKLYAEWVLKHGGTWVGRQIVQNAPGIIKTAVGTAVGGGILGKLLKWW